MSPGLVKLLTMASGPISDVEPAEDLRLAQPALFDLLAVRNGFYALEGALHLFPSGKSATFPTLEEWNAAMTWRHRYPDLPGDRFLFGENALGEQFAISASSVELFDPETGSLKEVAADLERWAAAVLDDNTLSAHSVAREWQLENGRLPAGHRLVPKRPFALGGDFVIENLCSMEALRGMLFRAEIAEQIRNLPEGAKIDFRVVE